LAGRGSVLKLRAQIASLRLAQGSRILIIMMGIDRAQQPVFAEQKPFDMFRQRVLGGKADIGGAGHDRRSNIGAFALLDIDVDIGMFAQESRQRLRQMLRQARGVGEQMDTGLGAAGEGGEIAAHRIDMVHDNAGVIEQAFACRGQLDAAAAALEQGHAERCFEALDPRAGGGQRQMGAERALRDAARVGYRDKELEVDQIEAHGDFRWLCLRQLRRLSP
jgi:hypothetical protein